MINDNEFNILTYVVKYLSSAIILGNDFFMKYNALVDYINKIIILDNNMQIELQINHLSALNHINKTKNILEIKDSIFNSPFDFAIAHCITADLKMSAGIPNLYAKYMVTHIKN
jgi:hypothetical protein